MFFDRNSNWFGHSVTHTLEPRAYYLYTPYEDQSGLPLFDTGRLDFNFDNMFRNNRFNGPDRVGDANQLALALSSSVLHEATGEELLRASIGQIYYFADRRVTLYDTDPVDTSSSSVIAQINGRINAKWQYRAGVQVDPHADQNSVRQALAQVVYHGNQNQLFNAAYRLRDGLVDQTDVGFIWPVTANMNMIGRWYYSLQDEQTMEAVAGLEYGRCCWRIRAILRHFLDDNGLDHTNTALIQLELNGLGKLGHDIDNYLDRSIYGY
jgi:LPS-assembly protein